MGVTQAERCRQEAERIHRRVELAAAGFLIPPLIVGFYGARTCVPGEERRELQAQLRAGK